MKKLSILMVSVLVLIAGFFGISRYNEFKTKMRIENYILSVHPNISLEEKDRLVSVILTESRKLTIPRGSALTNQAMVVASIIRVESAFRKRARSYMDAKGYMQLMPATYDLIRRNKQGRLSRDIFETESNLAAGVAYMNDMVREFRNLRQACLAYNVGPGALKRGIYVESYWKKVQDSYAELEGTSLTKENWSAMVSLALR